MCVLIECVPLLAHLPLPILCKGANHPVLPVANRAVVCVHFPECACGSLKDVVFVAGHLTSESGTRPNTGGQGRCRLAVSCLAAKMAAETWWV